jgi:soluble lytic murein transglycosylase-like protein
MRGQLSALPTISPRSKDVPMKIFLSTIVFIFVSNISLTLFYTKKFEKYREETNKVSVSFEEQNKLLLDENDRLYAVLSKQEQQISILEEAISPSDKRWAKIKRVREAVLSFIKEYGLKNNMDISTLTAYAGAVVDYSEQYDVKIPLILAITAQESAFNPKVTSHAGAQGLMQLMPATAKECASSVNKNFYNTFKVQDNVQLGVFYLSKMLYVFEDDVELAIRSYNCGPVYVRKVQAGDLENYPRETVNYHVQVMKYRERFMKAGL